MSAVRTTRAAARVIVAAAFLASHVQPAFAYLHYGVPANGTTVTLKWTQTPRYYVNAQTAVDGVSNADFQATVAKAFATWDAVPTSVLSHQFAGLTSAEPGVDDGISVLGFEMQPGTLAQTGTMFDVGGGVKRVLMTRSGTLTGVGLRADIRARTRSRSLALDDRAHVSPMIGVAPFMRF